MSRSSLRRAALAFGLAGALAQLGIAFMGYAIGGPSLVVLLLVVDALVAVAGVALLTRAPAIAVVMLGVAAVGSLVALFITTLLEIVVTLLLGAAATSAFQSGRHRGGALS